MTLLDNELVRKYFGSPKAWETWSNQEHTCTSQRILQAMQQPIRREDRYLCIHEHDGNITFEEAQGNISLYNRWHPECLRLPDAFQKQKCVHCFCRVNGSCCYCKDKCEQLKKCGCYHPLTMAIHNKGICSCSCHKTKGVVEDKIMELAAKHGAISGGWEHELRDLVRIARETK